jgi:uncharacterized delta-60 repeat protein
MNKLCLLLLFCVGTLKASSQAGNLDSTFGNNGIQTTAFFNNVNSLDEEGRAVLLSASESIFVVVLVDSYPSYTRIAKYLPDGRLDSTYGNVGYSDTLNIEIAGAVMYGDKIIVVGITYNDYFSDFALARYTADGRLDSSFGVNGKVTTDFNNSDDEANAIALEGDKIIVAGYTGYPNYDFALARYTVDGTLDASFGKNGRVTTDFNSYDVAFSIALQGDNILVAGSVLARYMADGTLDSSFGVNGKVMIDFYSFSIVLQGDKIVVAGGIDPDSDNTDFALARYTADGVLDSSFGVNGKVTTDFNSDDDQAYSIALQGNRIIVGGYSGYIYKSSVIEIAGYTTNGALDSSFGQNGKVTTDFKASGNHAYSIALQGGKIVVVGDIGNPDSDNIDFAHVRYTADGALDASFGKNGLLTGYFPSGRTSTIFTSTVIQGCKIITAGYALNDNNKYDFALACYTAVGTLDSSFGVNGKVTTDFNNSDDEANAIALQGDKIIVAGITVYPNYDFALARYTADGRLDSSFGVNGKVTTNFSNSRYNTYDEAYSIALQEDKIIVAGSSGGGFALARYTANGVLDSSFGENGKVTTYFNSGHVEDNQAYSIALQGNKILVAGNISYYDQNDPSDFALARYTADGYLDTSFGENGLVTTDFNNSRDVATPMTLQGDKIIAAGYTYDSVVGNNDFALARYTADGKLDSSFGGNGKITTDFNGGEDYANAIVLQGDKIIVAGYTGDYYSDFTLARYTADGTLDSSFGENGKVTSDFNNSSEDDISLIQAVALHENRLYAVGSVATELPYYYYSKTYGVVAAYQLETPEPTITIADVTVPESKKLAVVTVRLSKPATKLVRVHFTTRDKTATSPQDYIPVKGTLLFIPGVNTTFKIYIPIINDNDCESTEQFEVLLTKAYNATIQDSVAAVTITDNDALITKQESTSLHINVNPNPSAGTFTVHLLGTDYKQPVTLRVFDVLGRLIEERKNAGIGQRFRLGDQYKAGTYIIEAAQGSQRVQTKVIRSGK